MEDLDTKLNWVASFPKSGNTWIRLVAQAYHTGEPNVQGQARLGDVGAQVWHDISPLPHTDIPVQLEPWLRPSAMFNIALMKEGAVPVKSHHGNYVIGGMKLWREPWTDLVVNPVRDPRDVCCSLKDHMGHESYIEAARFMDQRGAQIDDEDSMTHYIGSWSMHVESWLDSDLDVLTVRYEDMQDAPVETFTGIMAHLLEREPDSKRLEEAVRKCEFDRLQKKEQEHGFPEATDEQDQFFRKGEAEGWKDELPGEVADKIVEDHADTMDTLNYL